MVETLKQTIEDLMRKWETPKGPNSPEDPGRFLKTIFTKKELEHVALCYFNKGILAVSVDSSSRLYSLSLQKEEMLRKLRAKTKVVIKDIRFTLGERA
jgi:hypothetical protein